MWRKTTSLTTKQISKKQIWQLFEDVNHWPSWDKELDWTELKGKFETGNYFLLKPKGGPKLKIKLLDVRPFYYFKDVTTLLLAKMYDEHIFEDTDEGLKITNIITVKGILGFFWVKVIAQKLADDMPNHIKIQIEIAKRYER
jgi:hypothetical protein